MTDWTSSPTIEIDEEDRNDLSLGVRRAIQHATTMTARIDKLDPLAIGAKGRRVSPLRARNVSHKKWLRKPWKSRWHLLPVTAMKRSRKRRI